MRRKGFTLVELLAVIVILAVIALIATPTVLDMIEQARAGAAERSTASYIKAIEDEVTVNLVNNSDNPIEDGVYTDLKKFEENYNLALKGKTPDEGWFKLKDGLVVDYSFKLGTYTISYDLDKKEAITEKDEELKEIPNEDNNSPEITAYSIGDTVTLIDGSSWVVIKDSSAENDNVTIMSSKYVKNSTNIGNSTGVDMFTDDSSLTTMQWHENATYRPSSWATTSSNTFVTSTLKTKLETSLNTLLSSVGMLSAGSLTDMGCSTSGCNISTEPFNKIFTSNNTNIWTTTYNGLQPSYMNSSGTLVLAYIYNSYSIRPIITVSKTLITNA